MSTAGADEEEEVEQSRRKGPVEFEDVVEEKDADGRRGALCCDCCCCWGAWSCRDE